MTADAAHVAEVYDALIRTGSLDESTGAIHFVATVAVETLTPLIRAQVAAEIRARADEDGDWIGQTDPDSILRMAARIAEGTP